MLAKTFLLAALLMGAISPAFSHLMPAQRGTINIVGNGAFVVLSVPVSAFTGADDDGDGKLSAMELNAHASQIETQVLQHLQLFDRDGPLPLQGLILNLSPPYNAPAAPAPQLVVLGRFALPGPATRLRLAIFLFGKAPEERVYNITASRGDESQLLIFNTDRVERPLFATAWSVCFDYVLLGAEHILTGFDHLLFMLVVLAAGWTWRLVLAALTCFTLGHCITLAISAWGGIHAPPALVEPAIAATVVGMVVFDWRARQSGTQSYVWLRLWLVFGCALIHGLGLGTTLQAFGLDSSHRIVSLAGFNIGIEIGQVAVALAASALMAGVRSVSGNTGIVMATHAASGAGAFIATFWFVQRVFAQM